MENKLWTRNFTLIIIITFLIYVPYNIFINTLPLHVKEIGGDSTQIGLVVSLFALAALIARPFAGNLLDNYGRKLFFRIVMIMITVVSFLYAFPLAIVVILAVRFIHGIFWGASSTAVASILSDVTIKEKRAEAWGYFVFASSIATAIGSVLGSFVMTAFSFVPTSLLASALLVVCCILALFIRLPKFEEKEASKRQKLSFSNLFEKKALFPSLLSVLLMMTMGFVMAFLIIFGKQIGVENAGIFFIGFTIMILVSKFVQKRLIERFGHKSVLIAGPICVIAALIILSFANGYILLVVSSLFYGFGYGTIAPELQAWAVNASPKDRIGAANGTFLASMDVGIAIGSSLFGMISNYLGLVNTFRLSSVCMAAFLVLYAWHLAHEKRICQTES